MWNPHIVNNFDEGILIIHGNRVTISTPEQTNCQRHKEARNLHCLSDNTERMLSSQLLCQLKCLCQSSLDCLEKASVNSFRQETCLRLYNEKNKERATSLLATSILESELQTANDLCIHLSMCNDREEPSIMNYFSTYETSLVDNHLLICSNTSWRTLLRQELFERRIMNADSENWKKFIKKLLNDATILCI